MDDVERLAVGPGQRMRIVKRIEDRDDDVNGGFDGKKAARPAHETVPASEMEAVHVLEHHEVRTLVFGKVEDAYDAGVAQVGHDARLAREHSDQSFVADQVRQDALDDDRFDEALRPFAPGKVDDPHAPGGEAMDDAVPTEDDLTDEVVVLRRAHGSPVSLLR
jgi:hypothetical protein